MLLMSKINSLLRFSRSWDELTQRGDNGCSGFVEGAQNSMIFFSFKYSQFSVLGSKWWRVMLFKCWYPHMPAGWHVRSDAWLGRLKYHHCVLVTPFGVPGPGLRGSWNCCLVWSATRGLMPVAVRSPTQRNLSDSAAHWLWEMNPHF